MRTGYEVPFLGDPSSYESKLLLYGNDLEHGSRAVAELVALQSEPELTQTDHSLTLRVSANELLSSELIFSISRASVLLFLLEQTAPSAKEFVRTLVRVVPLPAEIDPEQVTAAMADGKVVLTLPLVNGR